MPAFAACAQTPGRILYAVIGATDPNNKVPALDAVPGAGVSNVAVALPVTLLQPGVAYTVTFGGQLYNFNGTCVASYVLAYKGGPIISSYATAPFACAAYSIWTFPFPAGIIPDTKGSAVLTASLQCGSTTINYAISVYIQ